MKRIITIKDLLRLTFSVTELPDKGWQGYGAPGHPYSRCNAIADQLRRAAVLSDAAGHALREVAYLRWLSEHPEIPDEVSLALQGAFLQHR